MFSIILLLAAEVSVTPVVQTLVEPDPKVMSQKEIRAFNASLEKTHAFYIRCVSTLEIGSLAKRNYSCRTNRQWELAETIGNDNAREAYEDMTSKSWRISN